MSLARIIGCFVVALASAGPGQAARVETPLTGFENRSEWSMFQSFKDDLCTASLSYVKDTDLMLLWYPRTEMLSITVNDPVLESVKEGTKYDVEVLFNKPSGLDDGWGTKKATGSTDTEGVPGFTLYLSGKIALTDFAASSVVSFWYKGKLADSFNLKGSSLMISELRRCSAEIIKNHPIDPFED
jgi:hypothetical protein